MVEDGGEDTMGGRKWCIWLWKESSGDVKMTHNDAQRIVSELLMMISYLIMNKLN